MIYILFLSMQMFKLQSAVEFIPLHIISLCIQSPVKSAVFLVSLASKHLNWKTDESVWKLAILFWCHKKLCWNGDNGLEFCKPYATLGFLWTATIILDSVRHTIILPLRELNKQQERNKNLVSCSTFHNKSHDNIYQNKWLDTKL